MDLLYPTHFLTVNFECYTLLDSFKQMILSAAESFSKALGSGGTTNVDSRRWSYSQESGENMEEMIPDGACCFPFCFKVFLS